MPLENISGLRIFVQVVDSGSLSACARVLGLTPTLVSRRLNRLEEELGVRLLQRTTRRLHVTDEGRAFYRRCKRILTELDAAEREVLPEPGEPRGTVRVVLGTIAIAYGVMEALGELLRAHPELSVQAAFTDQPVDVVAGGWDVVLHVGRPPDSTHIARRIGVARTVMAATPEYLARHGVPRGPEDLAHHECLRFTSTRPQDTWSLTDPDGAEHEVPVHGRLEMDNSAALCRAMYTGLGIGLSPESQLQNAFHKGVLVPVLPGWRFTEVPLYALVPSGRQHLPRIRVMLDWLEDYVAALG